MTKEITVVGNGEPMTIASNLPPQDISFFVNYDYKTPILKLCANGDIYVKGKLVENDKEVVEGMRSFLQGVRVK